MGGKLQAALGFLRGKAVVLAVLAVLLGLAVYGIRAARSERSRPRRVVPIFQAQLQRDQPPPPRIKPPPTPKLDEPEPTRVELKPTDLLPPDEPPPDSQPPPGPLALAGEATGPGDAFNLAGNPGGRSLIAGGAGEGSGGLGGESDPRARYGWYYGKVASALEDALRTNKLVSTAATRVEVRVWSEPDGTISKITLVRSTGDPKLDEAIRSSVGLRLRDAPPADIPMPMVLRITARRPG